MGCELVILVGGYHVFPSVKTKHFRSVNLMRSSSAPCSVCKFTEDVGYFGKGTVFPK
jgi:hypothetical protein